MHRSALFPLLLLPITVLAQTVSSSITDGLSETPATVEVTWSDKEIVSNANFVVYVHWGDGVITKVPVEQTLKGATNAFSAVGSHTYTQAGKYSGHVTIYQPGNQYKLFVPFSVTRRLVGILVPVAQFSPKSRWATLIIFRHLPAQLVRAHPSPL